MKVILFGATGMIGTGTLIECLDEPRVEQVLSIGRTATGRDHPKLREVVRDDMWRLDDLERDLSGFDACFFCLGVSSAGMSEAEYHRITHDLTLAVAELLARINPGMTFCYVSGEGADSSERGRTMWARVKGKIENRLFELPLQVYIFRPGYIQPVKGARSKTKLYQLFYALFSPVYPLLKRLMRERVTTTEEVGRAMIAVAMEPPGRRILENPDINGLSELSKV